MARTIRAIYVEDEPSVRDVMVRLLELGGINVTSSYRSGEDLLQDRDTIAYAEADVFIFDVRLPGMTGLELAARLREDGDPRPVVAVSAWPQPDQEDLTRADIEFVRKPFLFGELEEVIRRVVDQDRD
ncbi:MAG: response regulator [Anaerolineae bacterium]|jgi:FixJ family two-component response regulator